MLLIACSTVAGCVAGWLGAAAKSKGSQPARNHAKQGSRHQKGRSTGLAIYNHQEQQPARRL